LDSRWIPYESMWSPYGFCIELWVEVFFRWSPSGLHMDLWSPGGLHLESVGEGKLHGNETMSDLGMQSLVCERHLFFV
jgi:hypothetical protein